MQLYAVCPVCQKTVDVATTWDGRHILALHGVNVLDEHPWCDGSAQVAIDPKP